MPKFVPEEGDVRTARILLSSLGLPTELTLQILDHAGYWPELTHDSKQHIAVITNEWSEDFSNCSSYLQARLPVEDPRFGGSKVKVKEIEWIIVSHDQGWTTENTEGTYETSSWFEAAILRPHPTSRPRPGVYRITNERPNMESSRQYFIDNHHWMMLPRPTPTQEPQRLHCPEMILVTLSDDSVEGLLASGVEGKYSWWLQGNVVARGMSVFEGEMVKRYKVVWGGNGNARWEGNEGAGKGEGFVDSLKEGDVIGVWARAKRKGWENHVHGVRMTIRYTF